MTHHILLLGSNGQVGWELKTWLTAIGKVTALDRQALNLSDKEAIRKTVREIKPTLIINAAAYTAVDHAEKDPEACMVINGIAPGILAEEAKKQKAIFVHYSTDYVFAGNGSQPYRESDSTNPINTYGKSKLAGEEAIQSVNGQHYIFRTSWVYGSRGKNFLLTMLKLAAERPQLKVVCDQLGAPTWSRTIAETTTRLLSQKNEEWGTYHLSNEGVTSWYHFAEAIFYHYQQINPTFKIPELIGIPSSDYPTPDRKSVV